MLPWLLQQALELVILAQLRVQLEQTCEELHL